MKFRTALWVMIMAYFVSLLEIVVLMELCTPLELTPLELTSLIAGTVIFPTSLNALAAATLWVLAIKNEVDYFSSIAGSVGAVLAVASVLLFGAFAVLPYFTFP